MLKWPVIIRRVQGHSMVPVLPPGTTVWAISWFRKIKPGQTVIISHDGREKIKRVSEVKEQELFVVGDHMAASTDSRHFGWIPSAAVIAKVVWPHAPQSRSEKLTS